jgi:hypothetical protein
MPVPRRDFMKLFGVSLGSLLLTRCQRAAETPTGAFQPPMMTCYEATRVLTTEEILTAQAPTARQQLRLCWLRFDDLAKRIQDSVDGGRPGWESDPIGTKMIADHRVVIDRLAVEGAIDAATADLLQEAYAAAVRHIWRSNVPIMCYDMAMPDYAPASADDLVRQSQTLEQVAAGATIVPETLSKIQAAVEHDLAFYALTDADVQALYGRLAAEYGDPGETIPAFAEVELNLTPEVRLAAQFLISVLMER